MSDAGARPKRTRAAACDHTRKISGARAAKEVDDPRIFSRALRVKFRRTTERCFSESIYGDVALPAREDRYG